LRIITPYLYPNNDLIEIFLEELPPSDVTITDLGETSRQLHSQGFDLFARGQRREMAEVIASRTGVEFRFGRLSKSGPISEVGNILLDVIVSARGVSDLIYLSRTYEPATFAEEVERFLVENDIKHSQSIKLTGHSGKVYTVGYMLDNVGSYLEPLSPRQQSSASSRVNAVVRMWFDCNGDLGKDRKLSLLNDVGVQWKSEDISILSNLSTVINWSERDTLLALISA